MYAITKKDEISNEIRSKRFVFFSLMKVCAFGMWEAENALKLCRHIQIL